VTAHHRPEWRSLLSGVGEYLSAPQARALIATVRPRDPVGKTRRRLVVELVGELDGIDRKIKAADKGLKALVLARGCTLMGLHGIGPTGAARLLADVGDIHRFADRDRSPPGTAPHRWTPPPAPSNATGSPVPATAASTAPCTSWPWSSCVTTPKDRAYFDTRKAAGKTSMEAMRALKRRLSNVVYARMIVDQNRRDAAGPGGHSGTTVQIQRDRPDPEDRLFGQASSRTLWGSRT
jgi:hypothetical protein